MKNRILSGIVAFAIVLSALANTGAVYAYGSESETENGNAVTQTVPADTTPEESTTPAGTTTEALPTETGHHGAYHHHTGCPGTRYHLRHGCGRQHLCK